MPGPPGELELSGRGGGVADGHLAQQLVQGGERVRRELGVEPEQVASLVNSTLEDELCDRLPVVAVLLGAVAALGENRPREMFNNKDKFFTDWL